MGYSPEVSNDRLFCFPWSGCGTQCINEPLWRHMPLTRNQTVDLSIICMVGTTSVMLCLPSPSAFSANHSGLFLTQSITEDMLIAQVEKNGPTLCTKHTQFLSIMTEDALQSIQISSKTHIKHLTPEVGRKKSWQLLLLCMLG